MDDGLDRSALMSQQQFADAFRAAYPVLLSVALGMTGHRADAEDVVQDAVVIGFRKRGDFQEGTSFVSWMAAIVRNVGLNDRRKRRRRDALSFDDAQVTASPLPDALPTDPKTGQIHPGQHAFDDRVQAALLGLNPVARACLLLRTVHDLDYETIAEMLEIPKNTALSHVHRARQSMRTQLAESAQLGTNPGGHA